jgi:hypothetical protein
MAEAGRGKRAADGSMLLHCVRESSRAKSESSMDFELYPALLVLRSLALWFVAPAALI